MRRDLHQAPPLPPPPPFLLLRAQLPTALLTSRRRYYRRRHGRRTVPSSSATQPSLLSSASNASPSLSGRKYSEVNPASGAGEGWEVSDRGCELGNRASEKRARPAGHGVAGGCSGALRSLSSRASSCPPCAELSLVARLPAIVVVRRLAVVAAPASDHCASARDRRVCRPARVCRALARAIVVRRPARVCRALARACRARQLPSPASNLGAFFSRQLASSAYDFVTSGVPIASPQEPCLAARLVVPRGNSVGTSLFLCIF